MSVTEENKHIVFIYGTLKQGQPNDYFMKTVIVTSEYMSKAKTTSDYPLVIAGQYNLPMLINNKGNGKNVQGELYRVNDEDLKQLDEFEGHPDFYERTEIQVIPLTEENVSRSSIKCWTYFIKHLKENEIKSVYLDDYDSYDNHGFPYDYTENDEHPDQV